MPAATQLLEQIGEGAFAVVFRGSQPAVDREVAIKVIRKELANRPEFIRRFEAEAHLVARLEHPRIVPLYDYWREPGSAWLVMRYLRGGTLADASRRSTARRSTRSRRSSDRSPTHSTRPTVRASSIAT